MINKNPCVEVSPSRGLHQGSPLSPYLFILCTEGLSTLIHHPKLNGALHGIKMAQASPAVSDLFFADDSLLFTKASCQEANMKKELLNAFETASGQAINYQKSTLCFSPNVNGGVRASIKFILGISMVTRLFLSRASIHYLSQSSRYLLSYRQKDRSTCGEMEREVVLSYGERSSY